MKPSVQASMGCVLVAAGIAGLAGVGSPSLAAPPEASPPRIESPLWLNSVPLGSESLRGKVVVVEFWTYGCVNCVRTFPAMRRLHELLREEDVRLVSVHTPEFEPEERLENVRAAVKKHRLRYPVAIDNDGSTWRSFRNRYWPAFHLLDRRGAVRHVHVGELHVDTPAWRDLLARIDRLREEAP